MTVMVIIDILAGRLIVSWVPAKFSVSLFKIATNRHLHDDDDDDYDDYVSDDDDDDYDDICWCPI